jgi:hypothetical protein
METAAEAAAGDDPAAAEILRATERERLRALVAADVARARRLHAESFQLINPLGGALSKEQYLGGIESGQIHYLFWEPDAIAVRVYGSIAALRYQSQLEVVVLGRHIPRQRYWHTDLYEQRDGRWQVVWSHATAIQESRAEPESPAPWRASREPDRRAEPGASD